MGCPSYLLALAGLLCNSGIAEAASSVEVVVAHYTENLSWTREYERPGVEFTVYSKSMPPPEGSIVLPNVGREAHTFLYHIVRHYHHLADWTVFTQAVRPSWGYHGGGEASGHLSDTVEFADYLRPFPNGSDSFFVFSAASQFPSARHINRVGFMIKNLKESVMGKSMCPPGAANGWTNWWWDASHPHLWAKASDITMLEFYHRFIAVNNEYTDEPLTLAFAQGARFAVSRERIHARPREYYAALLEQLSHSIMPMEGYWMEAAWYDVFHPEALQSKRLPCTLPPMPSAEGILSIPAMQGELLRRATEERLLEDSNEMGTPHRVLSRSNAYASAYTITATPTMSATPTTTTTTTTTEEPIRLKISSLVENLDYNVIMNDENKKNKLIKAFENAVKESFKNQVLGMTTRLFAGSVRLETTATYRTAVAPSSTKLNQALVAMNTNLATEVKAVQADLGNAVTGPLKVTGINVEKILPPPPPGVTTTQAACTWRYMHAGYCFPGGEQEEKSYRMGGWADGGIEAAQEACCIDTFCGGFHWESNTAKYVLLDKIGEAQASPQDGTRRQCWKKHSGTDEILES